MKNIKCPNCGANLSFIDDKMIGFCQYCGTKIDLATQRVVKESTHREINEAKIREADMKEKINLREIELKERELKINIFLRAMPMLIWAVIFLIIFFMYSITEKNNYYSLITMMLIIGLPIVAIMTYITYIASKKDK